MQKKGYFLTKSDDLDIITIEYLLSDYSLMGYAEIPDINNENNTEVDANTTENLNKVKKTETLAKNLEKTNPPKSTDIKNNTAVSTKVEAPKSTTPEQLATKNFQNEFSSRTAKNILKQYISTPLEKLSIKEVYALPDTAKANLAYLSVMI